MASNKSSISATVLQVELYAMQENFSLLHLKIHSFKKTEDLKMPGAEKGATLKAIISNTTINELKIKTATKIECELKKVAIDLWRVIDLKVKNQKEK